MADQARVQVASVKATAQPQRSFERTTKPACDTCAGETEHVMREGSVSAPPPIQLKSASSEDAYEREADQVAEQVVRGAANAKTLCSKCGASKPPSVQRKACSACGSKDDEPAVQRKALGSGNVPASAPSPASLREGGQPLASSVRGFFEPRFGYDFSGVRVHTDAEAAQTTDAYGAAALTSGRHVWFGAGQYNPASDAGRKLVAHELAHVVQQSFFSDRTPPVQRRSKGPGGCGWVDLVAGTTIGGAAHIQIQKVLAARGLTAEQLIPRGVKTSAGLGCAKPTTGRGWADIIKKNPAGASITEIKPIYIAKAGVAVAEALHYILRSKQSQQRTNKFGQCGKQVADVDDATFFAQVNATRAAKFNLLKGAITGTEDFGVFSLDPHRNLFAKEVTRGAIGYWCRLNSAGRKKAKEDKEKKKKEEEKKKKKKQEEKERKKKEKERKKREREEKKRKEKEKKRKEKEKKQKEKQKKESKKDPKQGAKAGAANVGIGISIFGSSVGGGNAGIGISVGSNTAGVGTASIGVSWFSDSAAALEASAGITSDSQSAGAVGVSAGTQDQSTSVGAVHATAGEQEGSMSAGGVTASTGKSEGDVTASAVTATQGDSSGNITATAVGSGSGNASGQKGASIGSPPASYDPKDATRPGANKVPAGETDAEVIAKEEAKAKGKGKGKGKGTDEEPAEETGEEEQAGGGQGAEQAGDGGQGAQQPGAGGDKQGAGDAGQGGQQADAGGQQGGQQTGGGTGTDPAGTQAQGGSKGQAGKPGIAVFPVFPADASEADKEKAIEESKKVAALLQNASEEQKAFMQDLASRSTDGEYRVPASEWVDKLMKATEGLTAEEIAQLKDLDWKPGSLSVEELRERIKKALKNKKPKSDDKPAGDKPAGDKPAGDKPGDDKATGGEGGDKKGSKKGDDAGGEEGEKKKKGAKGGGVDDRATDPPAGVKEKAKGSFRFVILSGLKASDNLKTGTEVICTVKIHDLDTKETFTLKDVSITFVSKKDSTTFMLYFTKSFWSEKNKFHGLGGPTTETEYSFGGTTKKKKKK
jgi:hypothetical protein